METQLLATFVAVARLGSFSAAATELGYTQAAVSQQVAVLEGDLRVRLLTRRPVAPTEAGVRLLEHAGPLLLRLDAARADVARVSQAPAAALAIGATPVAAATVGLARALAVLRRRMPRTAVTVRCGDSSAVATAVARGEDDLGLVHGLAAPGDPLPPPAPLAGIGVAEEAITVVFPAGHPLAGQSGIRLPALADARWIDAPGAAVALPGIRRAAGSEGFRAAIRYDGTDTGTLLALVAAGHGLALLPASDGLAANSELALVPVTDPPIAHRVELVHGTIRAGSPAAELETLLRRRLLAGPAAVAFGLGAAALGFQAALAGTPGRFRGDAGRFRRGDRLAQQGGEPGPRLFAVHQLAALTRGGDREDSAGQPAGQAVQDPAPRRLRQ